MSNRIQNYIEALSLCAPQCNYNKSDNLHICNNNNTTKASLAPIFYYRTMNLQQISRPPRTKCVNHITHMKNHQKLNFQRWVFL